MFECHITCYLRDAIPAQKIADQLHWSTSQIERDPVLGKDSYFYLTSHDNDLVRLQTRMKMVVDFLKLSDVAVVREKIEVIIHDTKRRKRS